MTQMGFKSSIILLALFLTACSQNANHLPSVFDLPSVIGSVFENANYQAKRKQVASYVSSNYEEIRRDVSLGGGKSLNGAFDIARVKKSKRAKARESFISEQKLIFENSGLVADALINVFSTLYVNESTAKDKRINGFNYFDARQLIERVATDNFENLRVAIKQGQGQGLEKLISALKITDHTKKNQFKKQAQSLYKTIYLEPVVVAIMINS